MGRRTEAPEKQAERERAAWWWARHVHTYLMPATADEPLHPIHVLMVGVRAKVDALRQRGEHEGRSAIETADEIRALLVAEGLERIACEADREP